MRVMPLRAWPIRSLHALLRAGAAKSRSRRPARFHHAREVSLCGNRRAAARSSRTVSSRRDSPCARGHLRQTRDVSDHHSGAQRAAGVTQVGAATGQLVRARLPSGRGPWLPLLKGPAPRRAVTLADLCLRISCGVATGADGVFVRPADGLDPALRHFGRPTIAGRSSRQGGRIFHRDFVMLIPYDAHSRLLPLEQLGGFGPLSDAQRHSRAAACACA